jgi:Mg-chelatase subunit ChlD
MKASKCLLSAALCILLATPLFADTRKDTIDVIVALDKSLSMETKIGSVEGWLNSYIVDQLLIPGDFLVVVAFYGKADVVVSQEIGDAASKQALKSQILKIRGNGRFTDIGNALDAVKAQIDSRSKDGKEKYVLLLTDGIQEAPPGSKYYSKNGLFNHEFLANTKTIQEKGWKVMILGIGTDTAARDLAKELQGSYGEITNNLTVNNLTTTTGALFGAASILGPISVSPIGRGGSSTISMKLKSSGLAGDAHITVSDITARVGTRYIPWVLSAPFTVTIKKDATTDVKIPVRFIDVLPPGNSSGTLVFSFSSPERFTPTEDTVTLTVNGVLMNYLPFFIAGIVLLLIVVALIVVLIWRLTKGKPVKFGLLIEDEPVGDDPITLSSGKELYLNENAGAFTLVLKRNAKSFASFGIKDGKVLLRILKQERFPKVKEVPPEARGKSFPFKAENGKALTMKVQSKERKK